MTLIITMSVLIDIWSDLHGIMMSVVSVAWSVLIMIYDNVCMLCVYNMHFFDVSFPA